MYLMHGIFGDETDFMVPINAPNIFDNLIARGGSGAHCAGHHGQSLLARHWL